jgi:hypothetical protein
MKSDMLVSQQEIRFLSGQSSDFRCEQDEVCRMIVRGELIGCSEVGDGREFVV